MRRMSSLVYLLMNTQSPFGRGFLLYDRFTRAGRRMGAASGYEKRAQGHLKEKRPCPLSCIIVPCRNQRQDLQKADRQILEHPPKSENIHKNLCIISIFIRAACMRGAISCRTDTPRGRCPGWIPPGSWRWGTAGRRWGRIPLASSARPACRRERTR